jgi:hypothetical protein
MYRVGEPVEPNCKRATVLVDRQSKTVVILQSGYLPWLGFFSQLYRSDIFVLYDDVQYTRRDWRNRNKVLSGQGPIWLTVPVHQKGLFHQPINETQISNETDWRAKHLASIKRNYSKTPYFEKYYQMLNQVLSCEWEGLSDLNLSLIEMIAEDMGLKNKIVRSSELGVEGCKSTRLLNICKHFGATHYLTGDMAQRYLDADLFEREQVEIVYHLYKHPVYRQTGDEFVPFMSVIDLLFNEGPKSLEILTNGFQ